MTKSRPLISNFEYRYSKFDIRSRILFIFFICSVSIFLPAHAADIQWISQHETSATVGSWTNYHPKMSGDGRFITFEARDASIPIHRSKFRAVFLFDRNKQSLRKLEPPNIERSNSNPILSEGGRYVAYESYPLSAVMGQPPFFSDIVIYDRFLNRHTFQTFGFPDKTLDGENLQPAFSSDGRYLVFTSNATLYPGLKNGVTRAIYLYDTFERVLSLVSAVNDTEPANRPSGDPRISRNGRYISYKSVSTNLVRLLPIDSLSSHLYLLDRKQAKLIRVDEPERGFDSNSWVVGSYDMDQSGRRIVLEGRQRIVDDPLKTLVSNDLFLFDVSSGTVNQITSGLFAGHAHDPSMSGDGRFIAFVFRGFNEHGNKVAPGLIVYDTLTQRWDKICEGATANPTFSQDGKWIAFESDEKDLVPGAPGGVSNIFAVANPFSE